MSEAVVTLLGSGSGYGESVVVKLYEHCWMVVDSCINPLTGDPLPLTYLEQNKIDTADVKLVVCTHWHSDHIKGLDRVLDKCSCAEFVCALASDKEKFLQYVIFEARDEKKGFSATDIFYNCLCIERNRNGNVRIASQDRTLYKNDFCTVYSLSPSDITMQKFLRNIIEACEHNKSNCKIQEILPNDECIVLWLQINKKHLILGGDLEKNGWNMILDDSQIICGNKFDLIKIPHHGSETAYVEKLWANYAGHVTAQVSSYNRAKNTLPRQNMLEKYFSLSDELYLTMSNNKKIAITKDRPKSIKKAIEQLNPSIKEIPYEFGLIESKVDTSTLNEKWKTRVGGSAKKIIFNNNL